MTIQWSADAKFVFILQRDGILRKISLGDQTEEREITFPGECSSLAVSQVGLVVAVNATQELCVLDENFEVLRRIPVVDPIRLASSRLSTVAFYIPAKTRRNDEIELDWKICAADLTTGTITTDSLQGGRSAPDINHCTMAPDGRHLFTTCGFSSCRLDRYRVEHLKLIHEETRNVLAGGFAYVHYVEIRSSSPSLLTMLDHPIHIMLRFIFVTLIIFTQIQSLYSTMRFFPPVSRPLTHRIFRRGKGFVICGVHAENGRLNVQIQLNDDQVPCVYYVHPDGKHVLIVTSDRSWNKHELVWLAIP